MNWAYKGEVREPREVWVCVDLWEVVLQQFQGRYVAEWHQRESAELDVGELEKMSVCVLEQCSKDYILVPWRVEAPCVSCMICLLHVHPRPELKVFEV